MPGEGPIGGSPISSSAGATPPPPPVDDRSRGIRFVKGNRSRHRSRTVVFNSALFHTGQEPAPPTAGARPHMRLRFTKGKRSRHESRVVMWRGSVPQPIEAKLFPFHFVKGTRSRHRSRVVYIRPHLIDWGRRATKLRGLYRVFNAAEFQFFRTLGSPPLESDSPYATNATLPFEPADTFADGEWYISMKQTNGVINSGFLPVGPNGETHVRLSLAAGLEVGAPPQAPFSVFAELRAGGVVRCLALYDEAAALRADEFVVSATFDGSAPPADPPTPQGVGAISSSGLNFLVFDLPAQVDGTTVRFRVQTRRTSPEVFSEGSAIILATADALGPAAPGGGTAWRGSIPAEEV